MRKKTSMILILFLAVACNPLIAQTALTEKNESKMKDNKSMVLDSMEKKISYAMGYDFGSILIEKYGDYEIESLVQGLRDAISGSTPLMDKEERLDAIFKLGEEMKKFKEQKAKEKVEKNKKDEEKFLAENAKKPGVITTESGLQYKIIKGGTGKLPGEHDAVVVKYKGMLIDGTVFDSSDKSGGTVLFFMNQLIKGWKEALQIMKEGSKWQLFIPSSLASGNKGTGEIAGQSPVIIYELELVEVKKATP